MSDQPYYSKFCPGCHAANEPRRERCARCGDSTMWPSVDAFRDYMLRTKKEAVIELLIGAGETFLGVLFLAVVLVVLREAARRGFLLLCGMVIVVTLITMAHGLRRVRRARKKMLFE